MRLIYLALAWIAGLLLAAGNPGSSMTILWFGLVLLALLNIWLTRKDKTQRWYMLALVAFTLGGLRATFIPTTSDIVAYHNSGGLTIEGVIVSEPDLRDDRVQMQVSAEFISRAGSTTPVQGLVLVQAARSQTVRYGDRIQATGTLIFPAEMDTFSYADYLGRAGVFSIMPNAAIEVLSGGHGSPLLAAMYDLKSRAHTIIQTHLPDPAAALLSGIILGLERGIPPALQDDFSAGGASHIIAISGFNMVVVSGVVMGLLNRFTERKGLAAGIGLTVIAAYTLLVGANAAVLRAALMSSLVTIAPLLRRKTYVPASLAFLLLVLSAVNPAVLWDVSFQLSFFATLGLALFTKPLTKRFDALLERLLPANAARTTSDMLSEPLMVTLAVQITTLPLIILYFNRMSLVLLPVNLLIVPVQSALLLVGGAAVLLGFVLPVAAQVLFWFDLVFLSWTISIVRLFANLSFAEIEFQIDSRIIALYFMVLIGGALMQAAQPAWALRLAAFVRQRAISSATLLAGVSTCVLMSALFFSRPDHNLHVWFLDMGHSNAVLVQTPGGAQILVDGGRFPSRLLTALGDRMPFNDREIEILVITQPDEFDTSALQAIATRYTLGAALHNGQPNLSESYLLLQEALARYPLVAVHAGYVLEMDDGTRLEVLHPAALPGINDSLDDSALVLRLTYGEVSFLLTGDLSREGQARLLMGDHFPVAAVMQLPQHGTIRSLSANFLNAVQPQVVVLQSDRTNRRGDPNPDILAMLPEVPVLRTDQSGTLHLWTDGQTLWYLPEK